MTANNISSFRNNNLKTVTISDMNFKKEVSLLATITDKLSQKTKNTRFNSVRRTSIKTI